MEKQLVRALFIANRFAEPEVKIRLPSPATLDLPFRSPLALVHCSPLHPAPHSSMDSSPPQLPLQPLQSFSPRAPSLPVADQLRHTS